ncbi:MAG TPA: class I SAM-dependent methyltransferase [Candidatus Limnocylindrales bacterium]|nr:class I SAM-dependent methyltransferase [Candidatus Limnocylindrales bacterium]
MSFDVAADAYDAFMGAWSRGLSAAFADFAAIERSAADRVLDVGCGTGALTAELVARVGAARVAGVDPSGSFVAAMRTRFPDVDVREGSAEALPHPDGAFDRVLAQLVVHFMTDPVAGIREMARVAAPGGTVAACVWDHVGAGGPLRPFWRAARSVVADVDDESRLPGVREGHLAALFAEAGLTEIATGAITATRDYPSFDDWWEPFTRGVGPAGSFLRAQPPGVADAVRAEAARSLPSGPFTLSGTAWAARGVA